MVVRMMMLGAVNIGFTVKVVALSQMEKTIEALSHDPNKLQTGRASDIGIFSACNCCWWLRES